MNWEEDKQNFVIGISQLTKENAYFNSIVFKRRYVLCLVKKWHLWPNIPSNFFEPCYVAWLANTAKSHSSDERSLSSTSKKGSVESCGSESDETGNPMDYVFENSMLEQLSMPINVYCVALESQNPMSYDDGMYLIELFNSYLSNNTGEDIPLVAFCDGLDIQKTVLIGKSRNQRILAVQHGKLVTMKDYDLVSTIYEKNLRDELNILKTETSLYAYYNILEGHCLPHSPNVLKPITSGLLAVECIGPVGKGFLQKPFADSSCEMIIQTVTGSESSGASNKFKELMLVESLYNCLERGEIVWRRGMEDVYVIGKIHNFLQELASSRTNIRITQKDVAQNLTDFNSTFVSYVTSNREDMDLTDHLWRMLQDCTSYEELTSALNFAFEQLSGFLFIPFISEGNQTWVAQLARRVNWNSMKYLNSFSTTPCVLLLEMGLEKLKKDYITIFVALQIIPQHFLLSITEKCDSFRSKLKCLKAFHTTLELLIIVWSYFSLPQLELRSFARLVLNHCVSKQDIPYKHNYRFPLSMTSITDVLDQIKPTIWQKSTKTTSSGDYVKQNLLHLNRKQVSWIDSKEKRAFASSSPSYYATTVSFISDNLPN